MFRERAGKYSSTAMRLGVHLTTECTTLPAFQWEDFDMVCGELEQYQHSVVEVVRYSNVISYD
jgi:hypothetical protein